MFKVLLSVLVVWALTEVALKLLFWMLGKLALGVLVYLGLSSVSLLLKQLSK